MRNYSKAGRVSGRKGLPGYRTPSVFRAKIHAIVKGIPKGQTMTYKQVAEKAERPKAWRAVGNILNKNCDPKIPCHRVIRSDGKFGGYNGGTLAKETKLRKEGVVKF